MDQLEIFITMVVPGTILALVALGAIIASIGAWHQHHAWNKVDSVCDEMDAYHYDVRQLERKHKQIIEDVYGSQSFVANILIEAFKKDRGDPVIVRFTMGGHDARGKRFTARRSNEYYEERRAEKFSCYAEQVE
jgi:hypothetical protein